MKVLSKQASRKVYRIFLVTLLLTAMLFTVMSGIGCSCKASPETIRERYNEYAGEYVNPDGTIFLNTDGTYNTVNTEERTTSGTYVIEEDEFAHFIVKFHQTYPEEVLGEATIKNGVLTNAYGQFVKK